MRRFLTRVFWLFAALLFAGRVASWWTEMWWFDEVGYRAVYLKIVGVRLSAFALGAGFCAAVLWWNARLAWRTRRAHAGSANPRERDGREDDGREDDGHELSGDDLPPFPELSGGRAGRSSKGRSVIGAAPDEPADEPSSIASSPADAVLFERYRRWLLTGVVGGLSFLGGAWASLHWALWLNFIHAVAVGRRDPVFGLDVGFFLFRLPALRFGWNFVFVVGCLALLLAFVVYSQGDDVEINSGGTSLSPPALRHLAGLGAALLLWKALGYRLNALDLPLSRHAFIFGADYTDIQVRLPLLTAMSVAATMTAAALWRWSARGEVRRAAWTLPIYGAVSALTLTVVPAVAQRVVVEPDEPRLEAPFIARHIAWTRRAYALDAVRHTTDTARDATPQRQSSAGAPDSPSSARFASFALTHIKQAAAGMALWPPEALLAILNARESETPYEFAGVDVDRYDIGGETRPVFVAARELPPRDGPGTTWVERRLRRTHGSGLVICDANRAGPDGQPLFYTGTPRRADGSGGRELTASPIRKAPRADKTGGQPAPGSSPLRVSPLRVSPLRVRRPEIFFGEFRSAEADGGLWTAGGGGSPALEPRLPAGPPFLPAGATREGARPPVPVNPAGDYVVLNAASNPPLVYSGAGGVPVGAAWRKWLLAWRFGDIRLALSPLVGPRSRVVWHRRVVERCRQIAPFLSFAGADPHPVLTPQGRIVWMLDGFTTSAGYPYAQPLGDGANYVRGAVKATVDAYDGTVRFYVADESDAVLRVHARSFPGLFQPLRSMPAFLRRHARYPAALLRAQAAIWARYHTGDAIAWALPSSYAAPRGLPPGLALSARVASNFTRGENGGMMGTTGAPGANGAAIEAPQNVREAAAEPSFVLLPAPPDGEREALPNAPADGRNTRGEVPAPPRLFASISLLRGTDATQRGTPGDSDSAPIAALLLADSDYGDYGGDDAGRASLAPRGRLWQWRPPIASDSSAAADANYPNPLQAYARITGAPVVKALLGDWKQQGANVVLGAPAAIPLGIWPRGSAGAAAGEWRDGSLLYVQSMMGWPGAGAAGPPYRNKVALLRHSRVALGDSVADALRRLMPPSKPRGAPATDKKLQRERLQGGRVLKRRQSKSRRETEPSPAALLARARAQLAAMRRARARGDWAAYGAAEKKLGELLKSTGTKSRGLR